MRWWMWTTCCWASTWARVAARASSCPPTGGPGPPRPSRTRCRCRGRAGSRWTPTPSGGPTSWRSAASSAPGGGGRVAGVCVSGVGPCLVLATRTAAAAPRDALRHRHARDRGDRRADPAVRRRGHPARAVARRSRPRRSGPSCSGSRHHEPEVWARTRRWFGASSFVVHRLTGEYVLDHHTASQCDPLYDLQRRDWAHDWARDIGGGCRCPAGLAERGRRARSRGGRRGDGPARGHSCRGRARSTPGPRRSARGAARRATSCSCTARRCSSCRCSGAAASTRCCGRRPASTPGSCTLAAGMATSGASPLGSRSSPAARRSRRSSPRRPRRRPGADGLAGPALLRRRADARSSTPGPGA